MIIILKSLYHFIVPKSIKQKIYTRRIQHYLVRLKQEIIEYYSKRPHDMVTDEQREVVAFLKNHPISVFPYSFQNKYKTIDIDVFDDESTDLRYIHFEGKRLYFKREWNTRRIKECSRLLMMEQDADSPHRYLADGFTIDADNIVVDVGCAEGNFSLSVVERAKKLYLFEANEGWIEPLRATFRPWKDKVEIIHKYVSNKNEGDRISLDTYFSERDKINFIKIDVENSETDVLEGSYNILKSGEPLKIALCTYHADEAELKLKTFLEKDGFTVSHSKGYMIYIHGGELHPPYLRRGLIRASRY